MAAIIAPDTRSVNNPSLPTRQGVTHDNHKHRSETEDRKWQQGRGGRPALRRGAAQDARLLAGRQLPVRRPDLPDGQPAPEGAAAAQARQAAPARPLGHHVGPELPLRPPEPGHQEVRPEHALHLRPRARRAGPGGQRLPGGDLQRGLPQHRPGRGGPEAAVHPVLVPRRHPQPRRPGDARLDPRGRRAGLRPVARLRGGLRQPGPDRRLRRRRRRGRDGAAGHRLARQQVPQPGPRRLRAAHPAPERLQDRQPHGARPHQPRGAGRPDARLRLHAPFRRGRRPGQDAPAPGAHPRPASSARSRPFRPTPARTASPSAPCGR